MLIVFYNTYKNSWSYIARQMPGRTEHAIKNRFHQLLNYRRSSASHRSKRVGSFFRQGR
jgi:UDP-N-acetylenolpyruvoylglucosamine reductase